jgi:hypothetical protein
MLMTAELCRAEDSVDLSVFALESYAEDDPLPEGFVVGHSNGCWLVVFCGRLAHLQSFTDATGDLNEFHRSDQ